LRVSSAGGLIATALVREQDGQHQHQAHAELPELRAHLGEVVFQPHVERRTDEGAVEAAAPSEDQDDQNRGRALEAERAQRDVGIGLREQSAGDACHRRRDGVDGDQPVVDRGPDRMHAAHVFANADQRPAERRVHDSPRDEEQHEQHAKGVDVVRAAVQVVLEDAEQRLDRDPGQPVEAPCDAGQGVAQLVQHDGDRERQHQQRQAPVAQQDPARNEPHQRGAGAGDRQLRERLAPPVARGEQPGGVGSGTEERRVTEGHDPRIAQDQIERQREHDHDQDLRAEREVVREEEEGADGEQPGNGLGGTPAVPPQQEIRRRRCVQHALIPCHRGQPA
jgi:hypothetical protein